MRVWLALLTSSMQRIVYSRTSFVTAPMNPSLLHQESSLWVELLGRMQNHLEGKYFNENSMSKWDVTLVPLGIGSIFTSGSSGKVTYIKDVCVCVCVCVCILHVYIYVSYMYITFIYVYNFYAVNSILSSQTQILSNYPFMIMFYSLEQRTLIKHCASVGFHYTFATHRALFNLGLKIHILW